MSDNLKLVFAGSRIDAMYLKELLDESKIPSIYQDVFQSSLNAGWAQGLPDTRGHLMVDEENYKDARKFINNYLNSR